MNEFLQPSNKYLSEFPNPYFDPLPEFQIIYTTCDSKTKAEEISGILLEKRLIACANIIHGVQSLYRWNNKIENSPEVIIIAKTINSLVSSAMEEIKSIHNYDCPCIISYPIVGIDTDYAMWLSNQLKSKLI